MCHRSPFQKIVRLGNCTNAQYGIDAIFVYIKMNVYLYNFNLYKSLRGYLQTDNIRPYLSIDLEELLCYNSKDTVY